MDHGTFRRRFHLRVHEDGSGVLFVDLADAVHLNPTAVLLVRWALEGCSRRQALRGLRRRYPSVSTHEAAQAVDAVFRWIDRLKTCQACCAWGGLAEVQAFAQSAGSGGSTGLCVASSPGKESSPVSLGKESSPLLAGAVWAVPMPLFSLPVRAPYKADVVLHYGCNNNCGHCYNSPDRRSYRPMSMEDWRRILEKLADLGVPHVILTGGEPTLCEDLPERIRQARRLGLVVGLNTNGRRLADPNLTARLAEAGLDHVQITLASCRPEVHNTLAQAASVRSLPQGNPFAETVQGIRNALAVGLHTLTNTTLTQANADHAEEIVDFLDRLGVRTFAMNGIIRSGRGRDFPEALSEEALGPVLVRVRDRALELGMRFLWYTPTRYCRLSPLELELGARRCNAGEYSLCIEPNGDVLPCQSYYRPVGNLLRDPWSAIWESPLFRRLRERVVDPIGSGLPWRCRQCPDLSVCGGGCMLDWAEDQADTKKPEHETTAFEGGRR